VWQHFCELKPKPRKGFKNTKWLRHFVFWYNLIRRRSDRKIVLIDFRSVKAISPDSLERFIEEENQTLVLWLVP
jgi:hypothetical protein